MIARLSDQQIEDALNRCGPGLEKYRWIMDRVHRGDVRLDADFQRTYNGFYRVRKAAPWRAVYFEMLERAKAQPMDFSGVLRGLYAGVGSVEASFASKLVATIDPTRPVWDRFVLRNFGLRKPYPYQDDQLGRTIRIYDELRRRSAALVGSAEGRRICDAFSARYPNAEVTDMKRIDLVLWQHRD